MIQELEKINEDEEYHETLVNISEDIFASVKKSLF